MSADRVIHPKFHHVNLKTTRLQEMIDWYVDVVGAEVLFQYAVRRLGLQRRGQPPDRADGVPELRRRPGEGHADRAAPHGLRVRQLRGAQRQLPAAEGGRDRAGVLPRSRHDVLVLLPRPRRQPRRAAGRQLRRLGEVQRVHARGPGVPRGPDRQVRRPGARRRGRARPARASRRSTRARWPGEFAPETPPLELPQVEA